MSLLYVKFKVLSEITEIFSHFILSLSKSWNFPGILRTGNHWKCCGHFSLSYWRTISCVRKSV